MSDGGDGGLEAQLNPVIDRLRTHNPSLLGVQLESAQASTGLIIFNALQVFPVNNNLAGDILWTLALEPLDLADDHLSVCLDCLLLHLFDHGFVALSASNKDLPLHELYQSLYK